MQGQEFERLAEVKGPGVPKYLGIRVGNNASGAGLGGRFRTRASGRSCFSCAAAIFPDRRCHRLRKLRLSLGARRASRASSPGDERPPGWKGLRGGPYPCAEFSGEPAGSGGHLQNPVPGPERALYYPEQEVSSRRVVSHSTTVPSALTSTESFSRVCEYPMRCLVPYRFRSVQDFKVTEGLRCNLPTSRQDFELLTYLEHLAKVDRVKEFANKVASSADPFAAPF